MAEREFTLEEIETWDYPTRRQQRLSYMRGKLLKILEKSPIIDKKPFILGVALELQIGKASIITYLELFEADGLITTDKDYIYKKGDLNEFLCPKTSTKPLSEMNN